MRKKRITLLGSILCLIFHFSFSQGRRCAVESKTTDLLRNEQLQSLIEQNRLKTNRQTRTATEIITIPVVIHVVHSDRSGIIGGENNGNISDEQILSQIRVLNNDFRRIPNTLGFNDNPVGTDMEINFELARKTPDGLPTNGIIRVYNPKASYDVFDDIDLLSQLSYWDSERYLNIWVTTLTDNYIGYAEFPTGDFNGLDFDETNPRTDGVIIEHTVFGNRTGTASFGSYTYGRTLTHEVGHWFGLIHTWGDSFCGTDYCEDTPQVSGPNNTNACVARPSRCDGVTRIPMIENYLDYTPDSCMNTFTQGQKERIRAIIEISQRRNRLVKAAQLNFQPVTETTLSIINNPGTNSTLQIRVDLPDFQDFTVNLFSLSGVLITSKEYIDFPGALITAGELTQKKGIYIVQLQTDTNVLTKKIILF